MEMEQGLVAAAILDGRGGARRIGWDGIAAWRPQQGPLWVHLDRNVDAACDWVGGAAGLDPLIAEALLEEETRPRTFATETGQLIILRGVNLNPGAEPEDMVGLRVWAEEHRVITIRYRRLMAVADILERLDRGVGPRAVGDLLALVADRLVERMKPVLAELGDQIDEIEAKLREERAPQVREQLRDTRNVAIILRRYLAPQRDLMARLADEPHGWLSAPNRSLLREVGNDITRYVEELEEVRERALVVQDEIGNRISEASNQRIYILTIISAIMLPLSFVTGLLGINVAGLPGTDDGAAFWVVCLILVVFGIVEYLVLRRLKWL